MQLRMWLYVCNEQFLRLGGDAALWWSWAVSQAERATQTWLESGVLERPRCSVAERVAQCWSWIDIRVRGPLLEALPAYIRETTISRGVAGTDVQCADVLFLAFRDWNVGDATEREAVLSQISAPVTASTIPAAIASLRRWRTSCRRAVELEIAMPDVQVRYRSVRRAFEGVLAQHHMLNMKLQMMELDGSLPNKPTEASLELVVCYLEGHFETLAATSAASGE